MCLIAARCSMVESRGLCGVLWLVFFCIVKLSWQKLCLGLQGKGPGVSGTKSQVSSCSKSQVIFVCPITCEDYALLFCRIHTRQYQLSPSSNIILEMSLDLCLLLWKSKETVQRKVLVNKVCCLKCVYFDVYTLCADHWIAYQIGSWLKLLQVCAWSHSVPIIEVSY